MPIKKDIKLWKQHRVSTAHLQHARQQLELPETVPARVGELLNWFDEYLDHNELELALDMLEEIGGLIPCRGGYWRTLERAAESMDLQERVPYFREQFHVALARFKDGGREDAP